MLITSTAKGRCESEPMPWDAAAGTSRLRQEKLVRSAAEEGRRSCPRRSSFRVADNPLRVYGYQPSAIGPRLFVAMAPASNCGVSRLYG
jgi:hypothetical protein